MIFEEILHLCLLLAHVCFNSFQGKLSLRHPIQDPHQIHHGPDANTKCEGMNSFCLASCIVIYYLETNLVAVVAVSWREKKLHVTHSSKQSRFVFLEYSNNGSCSSLKSVASDVLSYLFESYTLSVKD